MGTIPASENVFPLVRMAEVAAPSTPSAGEAHLYAKSDGLLYWKDDAGTEYSVGAAAAHIADTSDAHDASAISIVDAGTLYTATDVEAALAEVMGAVGGAGAVGTDVIWDAAGDLAVGSGSNTAARLAIGASNGMDLRRVAGAVAWAFPPGHELDYVEYTSPVSITATAIGSANTIVTANAVSFDGSTVALVEFFSPYVANPTGDSVRVFLFDGSTSLGALGLGTAVASGASTRSPSAHGTRRLTPSNASHTYSIRGTVGSGTGSIGAGAGGSTVSDILPGFIRISRV